MPFSQSVKARVLVAAARHCCVCHRYKGLNIEVHHIEQESESEDNSFENAIGLCFDCHADAGHYNPGHPRGTKLSASELRRARDRWFEIVATTSLTRIIQEGSDIGIDTKASAWYKCFVYRHLPTTEALA